MCAAENPLTLISSSFQPAGKVEKKEGGYTLVTTGPTWGFSSGIDEATWLFVGGIIRGRGWCFFLVPKSQVTIVDDWHVLGLRGSGSKSFTIDKEVRAGIPDDQRPGVKRRQRTWGNAELPAIARFPRKAGAGFEIAAVPLGAALGMLDDFTALMKDRLANGAKSPAEQPVALRIAECASDQVTIGNPRAGVGLDEDHPILGIQVRRIGVQLRGRPCDQGGARFASGDLEGLTAQHHPGAGG